MNQKKFIQFCEKTTFVDSTKKTFAILFDRTHTENCQELAAALAKREKLDLSDAYIRDASPLSWMVQLKELNLSHNLITSWHFLKPFKNLTKLDLSYSPVTFVSFKDFPHLKELNLTETAIPSDRLDFSNNPDLETVELPPNLTRSGSLELVRSLKELKNLKNVVLRDGGEGLLLYDLLLEAIPSQLEPLEESVVREDFFRKNPACKVSDWSLCQVRHMFRWSAEPDALDLSFFDKMSYYFSRDPWILIEQSGNKNPTLMVTYLKPTAYIDGNNDIRLPEQNWLYGEGNVFDTFSQTGLEVEFYAWKYFRMTQRGRTLLCSLWTQKPQTFGARLPYELAHKGTAKMQLQADPLPSEAIQTLREVERTQGLRLKDWLKTQNWDVFPSGRMEGLQNWLWTNSELRLLARIDTQKYCENQKK